MNATIIIHRGPREFLQYRGYGRYGELELSPACRVGPHVLTVQAETCKQFKIPQWTMTAPSRVREYARPRQVAMYVTRRCTNRSLPEIGRMFGGRDHTTVIHAIRRIDKLRGEDPELNSEVETLLRRFG